MIEIQRDVKLMMSLKKWMIDFFILLKERKTTKTKIKIKLGKII